MRNFTTTYSAAHMYGPGDEETWSPYAGHPLDPRQPAEADETTRAEARNEIIGQRIRSDIVWFTEAVEEAEDITLQVLVASFLQQDWITLGAAMEKILDYASPTDEEITDHIRGQQ